jgi:hypothetical protein
VPLAAGFVTVTWMIIFRGVAPGRYFSPDARSGGGQAEVAEP